MLAFDSNDDIMKGVREDRVRMNTAYSNFHKKLAKTIGTTDSSWDRYDRQPPLVGTAEKRGLALANLITLYVGLIIENGNGNPQSNYEYLNDFIHRLDEFDGSNTKEEENWEASLK